MNNDALKQPLLQALISDQTLDQAHAWLLSDGKPGHPEWQQTLKLELR